MAHPALTSNHARSTSNIHVRKACLALTSDHERNQSSIHVIKALHLHLTMQGTNPTYMSKRLCTYIRPCEEPIQPTCRKGSALTFDHARNQSNIHARKGSALISAHVRNQSNTHVRRDIHVYLPMQGTNPAYMSEGLCTYI